MSSSSSASNSISEDADATQTSNLQRKSNDIGWEFGTLIDLNNLDKIQCKICGKMMSGGVHRLKQHVAKIQGNVSACPKATSEQQEKCRIAIKEAQEKRKRSLVKDQNIRHSMMIDDRNEEEALDIEGLEEKKPRIFGPIDRYTLFNPKSSTSIGSALRQQNIQDACAKERLKKVHEYIARWIYIHGVPFDVIDNDEFKMLVEAIGLYGPGATPPSQYQLREPLLKSEVERMKDIVKEEEKEWSLNGCSVTIDASTDRKRMITMNLCINCRKGTSFLSSKDCSSDAHTGQFIFEYVKECIEKVGVENVVQVVTDNATNNMVASKLLKNVMPGIFWTSCATHTINLILESIANVDKFKETIERAKAFTSFIYAHHEILSMMKVYTKKRDIVRSGVTRVASAYLSLQSLDAEQEGLKMMFASKEWADCKWSKHPKGKAAYATVMSFSFWNDITLCLKVFAPLVRVLRLVDGDLKPSMGFLYGELQIAKNEICAAYENIEKNYKPIVSIVDETIKGRLDSPLHLVACLLNPRYSYKDSTIQSDDNMVNAMLKCVEAFFPNNLEAQSSIINIELSKYKNKEGHFGKIYAIKGCEKNDGIRYNPVDWWDTYGTGTPHLRKMATRILSLTTSSSGCKRNWSTLERVHTKKRNRLDTKSLNNLVYIQFNTRLMVQRKRQMNNTLDVLLSNDSYHVQDWIVYSEKLRDEPREEFEGSNQNTVMCEGSRDQLDDLLMVRELDDSDFDSKEEVNVKFESDE